MRSGWLKFHRALLDSDLWLEDPFSRGQAWLDLLGMAAFKATSVRINGRKIDLKPGQLCWSVLQLGKRWKWSRGKTQRFFLELKTGQQIRQVSVGVSTVTTIVNWHKYQSRETPSRTHDGTLGGTHDGTQSKNVKNVQEGEEAKAPASPPPSTTKMTLAEMRFACHVGEDEGDAFELICDTFTKPFIRQAIEKRRKFRERNGWKPKPCLSDLSQWITDNVNNYEETRHGIRNDRD